MPAADPSLVLITTAHREGSSGPSQDRVFVGTRSVVVLDGAAGPAPWDYDGGSDADRLGIELMRQLEVTPSIDLGVALKRALAGEESPSTAVSIVRWSDVDVDVLVLGTSPVVARRRDGRVDALREHRLSPDRALSASWPAAQLDCVAVMTDGVAAGVEVYGAPADWATAVAIAADSPQALVNAVHATEESDPDGGTWPRRRRHDDKAIAVITFARSQ